MTGDEYFPLATVLKTRASGDLGALRNEVLVRFKKLMF